MDRKIKHLELIQGIINRMASNSFMLKGWAVTLIAGIFAITSKDADKMYFFIVYIPIIMFWFLDTYYLQQERLYIALYNEVRLKNETDIDFSLEAAHCNTTSYTKYKKCLTSNTEIWFYLPLVIICTVIIISYS